MDVFASMGTQLGQRPVQPSAAAPVRKRSPNVHRVAKQMPQVLNPWRLSGIQVAIIRKVIEGEQLKAIADDLGLSCKTVDAHIARAKFSLAVHTLVQLAVAWDRFDRSERPMQ